MTFLFNCWYVLGWSHEFPAGKPVSAMALDTPLVLYRKRDGGMVVLDDRCCHRLAPLSLGEVEGDDLRCMYHGLKYAPSGQCIEIPGQEKIPPDYGVHSYPVIERDSWIWVWMGARDKADPTLIPASFGLDDPRYILRSDRMNYEANYMLINDNLMDLSHISYVHRSTNSLGAGNMEWATNRPKFTILPHGVRVDRWMRAEAFPKRQLNANFPYDPGPVDKWSSYEFLVPGIFILKTEWYEAGTADASGGGAPTIQPLQSGCTCQAVLPLTENSSTYVFSFGPATRTGTPELADSMMKMLILAFNEDRHMIEAQQKVIDRSPNQKMLPTAADSGVARFRWIMDRLIREERNEQPPAQRAQGS